MFRKVSAPNQLVSVVTQEVPKSVSKTPSLTFLCSRTGATRVTMAGRLNRQGLQAESRAWDTGLSPVTPSTYE